MVQEVGIMICQDRKSNFYQPFSIESFNWLASWNRNNLEIPDWVARQFFNGNSIYVNNVKIKQGFNQYNSEFKEAIKKEIGNMDFCEFSNDFEDCEITGQFEYIDSISDLNTFLKKHNLIQVDEYSYPSI